MTLYALYSRPDRGPDALKAIKQRLFWSAMLFTPLWALVNRAWALMALWLAVVLAVILAVGIIGAQAGLALYVVFAVWCGFAAPQILERALIRRDWVAHGILDAMSAQAAESVWIAKRYGVRP